MTISNKIFWIPLVIFLVALILRLPFLGYIKVPEFDEIIYETYVLKYLQHRPYFADHPPLAVMIWAMVADSEKTRTTEPTAHNLETFNNFPFQKERGMMAIMGALIPVSVYFIVRRLYRPGWCAIAAIIPVIFDNALITLSRCMLPDTILLCLGFGGLALIMNSETVESKYFSRMFFITGGVFLGGALSVKWTALSFIAIVFLWQGFRRQYKKILLLILMVCITHIFVWLVFFGNFGNNTQPVYFPLASYTRGIVYPTGNNLFKIISYLPTQFRNMFLIHEVKVKHDESSSPLFWPVGAGKINFYKNGEISIYLQANYFAWYMVIFAFITAIILISLPPKMYVNYVRWFIEERKLILILFGYLISYIPLYFVGRPMYLYHYLTPVIYGYMLVPVLLGIIKYRYAKFIYCGSIFLGFIFVLPVTYGITVPQWWINILGKI